MGKANKYLWTSNLPFAILPTYFLQLQHRKPGYLSPVTALYFPFTINLWMAVIMAIFVSLCFSLIYVIVHPEPELSVYKLITSTFASIFEQSSAASSLHSNTLRSYCLIK